MKIKLDATKLMQNIRAHAAPNVKQEYLDAREVYTKRVQDLIDEHTVTAEGTHMRSREARQWLETEYDLPCYSSQVFNRACNRGGHKIGYIAKITGNPVILNRAPKDSKQWNLYMELVWLYVGSVTYKKQVTRNPQAES